MKGGGAVLIALPDEDFVPVDIDAAGDGCRAPLGFVFPGGRADAVARIDLEAQEDAAEGVLAGAVVEDADAAFVRGKTRAKSGLIARSLAASGSSRARWTSASAVFASGESGRP